LVHSPDRSDLGARAFGRRARGRTRGNAAQQQVKVAELYKADLVTTEGKEASMFLAELGPGANMGKHYHPRDTFAYILDGTMLLRLKAANRSR
jgi:quercetin dioxygenase-like cupin family protein